MNALWNILAYSLGIAAMMVFLAVCAGAVIYFFVLPAAAAKKETSATNTEKPPAKGLTAKVKKAIAERPPWLFSIGTTAGGWVFLLIAMYVLLPSVWQWLSEHPAFFLMPPLCLAVAGLLYASKKLSGQLLAALILAVLVIALMSALPQSTYETYERKETDLGANTPQHTASYGPVRWDNCVALPSDRDLKKPAVTTTLYAPVGVESPCYLIRDDYRFRLSPKAPTRIRWQNGLVQHLDQNPKALVHLGVWDAAFTLMSLGEKPARFVVRLQKK